MWVILCVSVFGIYVVSECFLVCFVTLRTDEIMTVYALSHHFFMDFTCLLTARYMLGVSR